MRARLLALSLCAVLPLACGRSKESTLPEPPTAGPGADSCAVYIERVTEGVRCQALDASRCSCEFIAAAGEPDSSVPLLDPNAVSEPGEPVAPPPAGPTASLVFSPGPTNTTVTCLAGPCPTSTAELISAPYPPVPATAAGTKIQLEFRAPDHEPQVSEYTLYPGANQIRFTLAPSTVPRPEGATLVFQGAPAGTRVECVSGPCPDKKAHDLDKFPLIKLTGEEQTLLLRFNAPGYRTGMSSYKVTRGPNVAPVLLEKAPSR